MLTVIRVTVGKRTSTAPSRMEEIGSSFRTHLIQTVSLGTAASGPDTSLAMFKIILMDILRIPRTRECA